MRSFPPSIPHTVAAAAVLVVWMSVLTPAGAQTTSVPAASTAPEPSPFSTGGIVFFVVVGIVAGGALVLYLRHRAGPGDRP